MADLDARRHTLRLHYHKEEASVVEALLQAYTVDASLKDRIRAEAENLILKARQSLEKASLVDSLLYKYKLSSQEGLALMCLAEALLRIPDRKTASQLIEDRLTDVAWENLSSSEDSTLLGLTNFALGMTGKILKKDKPKGLSGSLKSILKKSSEPLIQHSVRQAMGLLSRKFVMGETIEAALKNAQSDEEMGYLHSYDMLGEAALTATDADHYFKAYEAAIHGIGKAAQGRGERNGPGISIKLSALHPRYEASQRDKAAQDLSDKLLQLAHLGKSYNIGLTIDAEESHRLELSLDILQNLLADPQIAQWGGVGFVVQAYQKRAYPLILWLESLCLSLNTSLRIRLVKGAYWDSEIKLAQEQGVEDFPVFTQKSSTDLSYLVCAQRLLESDVFYPMFATHNAQTISSIYHMAQGKDYEFQKLYGMGNELYKAVVEDSGENIKCRVYAPVGTYKDLLPYLVRRLLENGANTSFINHVAETSIPLETLTEDPYEKVLKAPTRAHPQIPLPKDLFGKDRVNSTGLNLADPLQLEDLQTHLAQKGNWSFGGDTPSTNPFSGEHVGTFEQKTEDDVSTAVQTATQAAFEWNQTPVSQRALALEKTADLLEKNLGELVALCAYEGGKTLPDGVAEVREAVDFCRYYAQQARQNFTTPVSLPGPTGEENTLSYGGRGLFVCISPWNFPLAIFTGQMAAALVTGNPVLAKPAGQTPLIAHVATNLFYQGGIPKDVLHLLPGPGSTVGNALIAHPDIAGVTLTGSTQTAWHINKTLAHKSGPLIPFIAETGGQNAMIVDSSALPEQVVQDVITSSFRSAGQRCSALRVLYIQEDIADRVLALLVGAMAELKLGDPRFLSTDVGPVIDQAAQKSLNAHKEDLKQKATLLYECPLPTTCKQGAFVTPAAFEIDSIKTLTQEHFGPILHVIRFQRGHMDKVLKEIQATGYGLTQGLHTRIQSRVQDLSPHFQCGNIYVNRNMIGAMVGVQPFGGAGLSGTGPKAGGPHYLYRFVTEKTLTINTTAQGGNTHLLSLQEI